MAEEEQKKQDEELSDMEIAELANKELKARNQEIAQLKKDLARMKLLSSGEEEEKPENRTTEECVKVLNTNGVSNYDYAQAVCEIVENAREANEPNPLGENGEEVYQFFKDVLEACDGDKSKFVSVYQAMIGADDPKVAMAYSKRKKNF